MHDSFSSRTLLLAAALAASACATTPTLTGTRTIRGGEIGRKDAPPMDTDRRYVAVKDDGADLRIARTRCVTTEITYRRMTEETFEGRTVRARGLNSGLLFLGLGAGVALLGNAAISDDSLGETAEYVGAGLAIGGLASILLDPPKSVVERSTRSTPLNETERESSRNCRDLDLQAPGPVPFTFAMEGQTVAGTTDASAHVSLVRPALQLLQRLRDDDRVIGMVIADRTLKATLTLGDAPSKPFSFSTRFLPDEFFEEIAGRYEARLSGSARSRWDTCRAIGRSRRENLECYLQP